MRIVSPVDLICPPSLVYQISQFVLDVDGEVIGHPRVGKFEGFLASVGHFGGECACIPTAATTRNLDKPPLAFAQTH